MTENVTFCLEYGHQEFALGLIDDSTSMYNRRSKILYLLLGRPCWWFLTLIPADVLDLREVS